MFDNAKAPHFNYLGDTVMGYNSHIGAGVICSNLKLDSSLVVLKDNDTIIDTKLKKFGAIIGDNSQIGCNSVLNPGTIIGKNVYIYPLSSVRGIIKSNSIYKNENDIINRS